MEKWKSELETLFHECQQHQQQQQQNKHQQYLSYNWPDFDQILKLGYWISNINNNNKQAWAE